MKEREIYEYLKNTSFVDILQLISKYSNTTIDSRKDDDIYYTAKDLFNLYPNVFSKFKLDKYIKNENLPVIKEGKDRLFLKSHIEEWLRQRRESQYGKVGI